jgi:hypothetical protein
MSLLSRLRRSDPRWEEDGPAARREYRRRRMREMTAFTTSLVAAAVAGAALAFRLGTALLSRG